MDAGLSACQKWFLFHNQIVEFMTMQACALVSFVMSGCEELAGVLAQLVERLVRNEKVRSSSLLGSTSLRLNAVKAKAAAP
jgi:hypothetical protein